MRGNGDGSSDGRVGILWLNQQQEKEEEIVEKTTNGEHNDKTRHTLIWFTNKFR